MYNKVETSKNDTIHKKSETTSNESTAHENKDSAIDDTMHEDTITIYKKINNVIAKILQGKFLLVYFFVLFIIFLTILCFKLTKDNNWEKVLTYPETSYTNLEEEAKRIAETHNFESKYKFKNIQYDYESKTLSFKLYDDSATLTVNIYNYKLENQSVDTIRTETSKLQHIFINIFALIAFGVLFPTVIIWWLTMGLASLIAFITFSIEKINNNRKKSKHKN